MFTTSLPCTTHPALLLIGPDIFSAKQFDQLSESRFCVTKAANAKDVFLLRGAFQFLVAVLSDTVGSLALRASAQIVRGHWPKAKILILGKVPIELDDHLYDESVVHASGGTALLMTLDRVLENLRSPSNEVRTTWLDQPGAAWRPQQRLVIRESNPAKGKSPIVEADDARDFPADEQIRRRTH